MRTYRQWEKSGLNLDDYLVPGDYIDEAIYLYIGEVVAPYFVSDRFVQCGEPSTHIDEIPYRTTAMKIGSKYLYLGDMPEFSEGECEDCLDCPDELDW